MKHVTALKKDLIARGERRAIHLGADPTLLRSSAELHDWQRMIQAAIFTCGFASCVTVGTGFDTSRRRSRRARYDSKSAHRPLRRTHLK